QLPDPGSQSTRVVRWHQEARLARDHRFTDATDIGRDDRLLGKKCLEHRQGESFEAGGQDEDVERTHVRSDLVAPPGPDGSIGHAQASRQTLELIAILSVTDDDNRRIVDVAHRPQKNVETLLESEPSDRSDNRPGGQPGSRTYLEVGHAVMDRSDRARPETDQFLDLARRPHADSDVAVDRSRRNSLR